VAEIKFKVCDRCGGKLKHRRLLIQRPRRFKFIRTSHDIYGYWETQYELCNPCGDELTEFLRRPKAIASIE